MSITLSLNHVGHPSHPSHRWPKVGTVGTNTLQETKLCSSTRAPPTILSWVGVFGVSRVVGAVENSVKHWDQTARDSMRYEKRAKWADKWVQMYIQDISRYIKIYQDISRYIKISLKCEIQLISIVIIPHVIPFTIHRACGQERPRIHSLCSFWM